MPTTKIKYWSSSPLAVPPDAAVIGGIGGKREHSILMSIKQGRKPEQTVRIATAINGAVSKRIAEALQKYEEKLT